MKKRKLTKEQRLELAEATIVAIEKAVNAQSPDDIEPQFRSAYELGRIDSILQFFHEGVKAH